MSEEELFQKYEKYIEKHGKTHKNMDELVKSYEIFKQNYIEMRQLRNNTKNIQFGTNEFMDMPNEEFSRSFANLIITEEELKEYQNLSSPSVEELAATMANATHHQGRRLDSDEVPENWDWRKTGVISPVKQQGKCGACWSFTTAANIESLYAIKYGELYNLSVQQAVDCSTQACNGGMFSIAYKYFMRAGGLQRFRSYPYKGYKATCKFNEDKVVAQVKDYVRIGSNEEAIKKYLYKYGPISAGINSRLLKYYKGGVLKYSKKRCSDKVDHAVLIVGYGVEDNKPYWIIKNSWGPYWGEDGYFRLYRGAGVCGINTYLMSAIVS